MADAPTPTSGWTDRAQVEWYVGRVGKLEARRAGEQMVADLLPASPWRVLDLGCGDGRLTALVLDARPSVEEVVAVDRSAPMLDLARARFTGDDRVVVRFGDMEESIASLGRFDLVVSGFAIHHLDDPRKRALFREIAEALNAHGVFVNLEVVASATPERHDDFIAAIGRTADDPEDRLASVDDQLAWMREAGMTNVDCLWRWRGFAVLAGEAPMG